jgi:hypothetical protein
MLEGRYVRFEPLARRHVKDLFEAGKDETIWAYMSRPPLKSFPATLDWIDQALAITPGVTQILL